jgi:O-antigen/teichoic acid export membrane protein
MIKKVAAALTGWFDRYRNSALMKKVSGLLAIDILVRASSIILLPLFLLLMTQQEYGLYMYIISIVTTFSVVLNFGLYVAQSKYYSDAATPERKQEIIFNVSLLLTLLLTAFILPVYLLGLDYTLVHWLFRNPIDYASYRWIILLAVVVSVYSVILLNYFMTSERLKLFRRYNLYRLLAVNIISLAALYFIRADNINIRLYATYLVELAMLLAFMWFYIKEMRPRADWKWMPRALKLSMPIMLSAIWGLLSNYSDKYFLEKNQDSAIDLSYYYLAFSISNVIYMVCTAVQNVWLPGFLREKDLKRNRHNTRRLVTQLAIGMLLLDIALVAGLAVALETGIIQSKYYPALYVLPLLLLAQNFAGISLFYSNYMIYFESTHWALFIGIVTSLVGVGASYLVIPIYNIYGAAFVYLSVQLLYFCFYYLLVRKKIKALTA